jgi:hypothetical protein
MKKYVAVPDALLANTKELKPYLGQSYTYVETFKPKATTRKKCCRRRPVRQPP